MTDHTSFVLLAYAICFLTIGGVALRIALDYRRLRDALSRFGDDAPLAARDDS